MKDLISTAIKSTYDTRNPGGVERCIDALDQLKSLSLSVKDILQFSKSIFKLETLRRHRNPKIRKASQSLFDSLLRTLYAQGRDKPSDLKRKGDQGSLMKKVSKTNLLVSNKKQDQGSLTKKEAKTNRLVSSKKQDQRSLTKKDTNTNLLASNKKQDQKSLTRETVVKIETKTDACKSVTTKQPLGDVKDAVKISSVTTTALPQQSSRNIKDKDGQVTTKTLIPPPKRVAVSANPKSAASKTKTEEMVELFEAAKKAADVANAKGILSGKADASRCVDAISLLMKINVTPKPKEPRMIERLVGLTKHKDRTIAHAASGLLQLWRQRISEQERRESATKTFSNNNPGKAHQTCGHGFARVHTKTMKLVM